MEDLEALLVRSARSGNDSERLRSYTLELVKRHPDSQQIVWANDAAFYRDPAYRTEVIRKMEQQVRAGKQSHLVYANLARLCEHGAFPILPERQEAFRRRYRLTVDLPLPSRIDGPRTTKAIGYWRSALMVGERGISDLARRAHFRNTYSDALASLLERLGKPGQARMFRRKR